MTGVAAIILLGDTTHHAVHLNQKARITREQVDSWEETHLLIIDKILFASKEDFGKLHQNLRKLKLRLHSPYGGLNIIFAGDRRQLEPVVKEKTPVYKENCPGNRCKKFVHSQLELRNELGICYALTC